MNMLGLAWLAHAAYAVWLFPLLIACSGLYVLLLLRSARHTGYGPAVLSVAGMIFILIGRAMFPMATWPLLTGVLLVVSGSLLNRSSWATSTRSSRVC